MYVLSAAIFGSSSPFAALSATPSPFATLKAMSSELTIQLKKNQELSEVFIYKIYVYIYIYSLNPHLMNIRVSDDINYIDILSVTS